MTPQVTAFRWVPSFAQGYVKDLRIRWALEEAGQAYEVVFAEPTDKYRQWQPFGQVPAYRDDEVFLFESGAILLHLASKYEALAPADVAGRARVSTWVFAALNSIEPHAQNFIRATDSMDEAWAKERQPHWEALLTGRLEALAAWLGDKDYLEGRFTAGDLVMTTVIRELVDSGMLARFPSLDAYRLRCEARPAFARAMAAHMAPFKENAPA
jgi:glutathione S-transferase